MVEDTDYIRVVVGSIPCAAIRGWSLRKMVCEYDKNIMEYLYQKKDTESHEDSDFFYDWGRNMKDCSICKYCDEDFVFDEETGEEYPFYGCQKKE